MRLSTGPFEHCRMKKPNFRRNSIQWCQFWQLYKTYTVKAEPQKKSSVAVATHLNIDRCKKNEITFWQGKI